jgi:hypothetical protein
VFFLVFFFSYFGNGGGGKANEFDADCAGGNGGWP